MVAPVFFLNWIEGWFCHHGGLYAVSFETASRDTQPSDYRETDVSKFYARQVVSDDRAAKPKSTRNNKFITQGEKFSGKRDSEGNSFCIEYIVAAFKATI